MLIYLDSSLIDCLDTPDIAENVLVALEGLSFLLRSGAHLVSGDINTLTKISSLDGLSAPCRSTFKRAAAKRSQALAVLRHIQVYVSIDFGREEIDNISINNVKVIRIPVNMLDNFNFHSSAEVVFEDINDSTVYSLIANWYTNKVLENKYLPLKFKKIQGGGNRTHAVYGEKQLERQTFCLCITDSDRKYPADAPGDTSQLVRETEDPRLPLSFHLDLDFHEIENLLPLSFLKSHSGTDQAKEVLAELEKAEANGHPEAKLYWDYKKGLKNHYTHQDQGYRDYWCRALNIPYSPCATICTPKACTCFLINPWPLKTEIKIALDSSPDLSPADCHVLRDTWQQIASMFVSWVIGSAPQST